MEHQRILVDTSVLIDHVRKKRKDKTVFFNLSLKYSCLISTITQFEFLVGANPKNVKFIQNLTTKLSVLPFDSKCVAIAVRIFLDLKMKNKLISLPDIFIAATAISNNLPLQTLNKKHFSRIENLTFPKPEH